jgi:hypothetical protein
MDRKSGKITLKTAAANPYSRAIYLFTGGDFVQVHAKELKPLPLILRGD